MLERPEPTSRKSLTLPDRLWNAVRDYRFDQRIETEAEAFRRLLQLGLDAAGRGRERQPTGRRPNTRRT